MQALRHGLCARRSISPVLKVCNRVKAADGPIRAPRDQRAVECKVRLDLRVGQQLRGKEVVVLARPNIRRAECRVIGEIASSEVKSPVVV